VRDEHLGLVSVRLVAQVEQVGSGVTATPLWYHPDGFGTASLITDDTGAAHQRQWFSPFGRRMNPDGSFAEGDPTSSVSSGFTGHEQDPGGFTNMGGRIYDPELRRFITPDPIVVPVYDVQSWNGYSYVGNMAAEHTDPTGFLPAPLPPPTQPPPNPYPEPSNASDLAFDPTLDPTWATRFAGAVLNGGGPSPVPLSTSSSATGNHRTSELVERFVNGVVAGVTGAVEGTLRDSPLGAAANGLYDTVDAIGRGDAAGALRGIASIQPNYIGMAQSSVQGLRHLGDQVVNGDAGDRAEALGTLTPAIVAMAFGRSMGRLNTGRGVAVADGVALEGGAVAEGAALGDSALAEAAPAARGVRPVTRAAKCFVAGTLVMLLTGATPIEEVEVGDIAVAYDARALEDVPLGPVAGEGLTGGDADAMGAPVRVAARSSEGPASLDHVETWDPNAPRTAPALRDAVLVLGERPRTARLLDVPDGVEVAHRGRVFEVLRWRGAVSLRATGRTLNRVVQTVSRTADALVELEVDGPSAVPTLRGTAEHPFFVPGRGEFVPMGELLDGDRLLSSSGAALRVATSQSIEVVATRVFNLSVEHAHTYLVGGQDDWVVVHNQCASPPAVRRVPQTPVGGTVDDLIAGSRPGRRTMGRTRQFERHGDFSQANADFDALGPTNVERYPNTGRRVGRLPDGRTVVVRPGSGRGGRGAPTLEIQRGSRRIKIRYIGD